MKLQARLLDIQAGGRRIAILDDETASLIGVHSSDRVEITHKKKHLVAIVNVAGNFPSNVVGVYEEVSARLGIESGDIIDVQPAQRPEAVNHVQAKIRGERLREAEAKMIVEEVVERHLSDIEIASFVTALHIHGLSMDEIEVLSKAMVETGSTLTFDKAPILDKHSIGGVPGDKTSLLIVPIIAAAGLTIPKTSSRAITSPAGTADRVETFCPVDLNIDEIREVVEKTNGCMVWGGALELAPADDIFIQVEYPLAIDPLLLPSIMSKKKAINATHLVIDIPTGRDAKVKRIGNANSLACDFVTLGKRLGMEVQCAVTYGEQPIGYAIGPALEAREALSTIMGDGPADLQEKATSIAGILFEMVGEADGKQKAESLLKSGKAERKLREIIEAQGGDPNVIPEDMKLGTRRAEITTQKDGRVLWINNRSVIQIAREAGAPKEKGAGIILKKKLGEHFRKGEVLFEVFAERAAKLNTAVELAERLQPIGLSKKPEERMLMNRVPACQVERKDFALER